jgi:hypothetical protein
MKPLQALRAALKPVPWALLGLTLASEPAQAQVPDSSPPPASEVAGLARTAFGAGRLDGAALAGGPDYKADFAEGRMRFTPALGTRAEHNLPVSFAFADARRGAEVLAVGSALDQASVAGAVVSIPRSGGIVERYEATERGLLLSFLVAEAPAGAGDLVLRGRLETELPYAGPSAEGGHVFELPGVGGVRIGGVTAVDAAGASIAGELRYSAEPGAEALELVVPSSFVDAATYPLVVDPEIGALVVIDDNTWNDGNPDVASTTAGDARYLVVWERRFSLSDVDIRGYRLDESGDYAGSLIFLENGAEISGRPAVAHVLLRERFFVAWQEAANVFAPFNIVGRAVDGAATGSVSAKIVLAPSANVQTNPDAGGERTVDDDDVYVVWGETNLGVRGCQVNLPASGGNPTVFGLQQISDPVAGDDNASPAISKTAGETGIFGLAYHFGTGDVMYRSMTRNGSLTGAQLLLASLSGPHREPAIDGDGTNFLMVFEKGEPFPATETDIWGVTMTYDGLLMKHVNEMPIEADGSDDETNPDVAFTGGQFLVGYLDVDGAQTNAYLTTVDPFSCLTCGDSSILSGTTGFDQDVRIATEYAAGLTGERAFGVWENFEGDGDILGQVFESSFGQEDLGGDCGMGGAAYTPCPFDGNGNFAFHLSGAEPFSAAFLVLGFQSAAFACGPCTLWPSLATADVFYAGLTDDHGRVSYPVALPAGAVGISFTTQWGVANDGSCPLFGVDVSNGVRTTIQP